MHFWAQVPQPCTTTEVASNLVRFWSFSTAIQIQGGCIYYLEFAPAQSPETIPYTRTSNPFPTQILCFIYSTSTLCHVLINLPLKRLAGSHKEATQQIPVPSHVAFMLWEELTATALTVMPPHPLHLCEVLCLLSPPTCTPALEPGRMCFLQYPKSLFCFRMSSFQFRTESIPSKNPTANS